MTKTGLGSSASLIVCLVGALLHHFNCISLNNTEHRPTYLILIHNIAQCCHSLAQGKIGSGFDIAAAIYGSHVYRRYLPECLNDIVRQSDENGILKITPHIVTYLMNRQNSWNHEIHPISLPHGTHFILGDIHLGTSTPQMASCVLNWKQSHPSEGIYS
jgi:phosphomevalonate kinase